jgi:hypothetical protein
MAPGASLSMICPSAIGKLRRLRLPLPPSPTLSFVQNGETGLGSSQSEDQCVKRLRQTKKPGERAGLFDKMNRV